jgi:hypothetical protein
MTSTKTRRKLRKITPALRRRIEKTVEQLIEALDHMDAPAEDLEDPADAEPTEDEEPSIGAVTATDQSVWGHGGIDDLEDEHDGAEPSEDPEPSLGSFDRMADQTKSYRQHEGPSMWLTDAEQDDADKEDAVPRKTTALPKTPSRAASRTRSGLREQVEIVGLPVE